jgi:hypothetical protein
MSLDEVGHSPRRLCWFCGVEQVAAAPASYQAYLALYEMDPATRGARTRARGTPVDRSGEPDIAADSAHSELGVPPKGS